METMKKLLKSGHTLIFTSIVLMFAIFVYFTNNFGYGWFAKDNQVTANGMWVEAIEPDSPIESYEFYKVSDVKTTVDDKGTPDDPGDDEFFDRYTFVELGAGETAQMNLGHYDKLARPDYHILLHISLKENAKTLYVDANISGGTYTIDKSELLDMVQSETRIGLSAVMDFYVIIPQNIDGNKNISCPDDTENTTGKKMFIFDSRYLSRCENDMFDQPNVNSLSFTSVSKMFTIDNLNDEDETFYVDKDGFKDVFIFMTYNADRVNLLQDALQKAIDEENEKNPDTNLGIEDLQKLQFRSDFSLRVNGIFDKSKEQE